MTERRVEVPGGRLAIHDFGEGLPIVLLHAGIVDAWAWEPLTPFLLKAGHRVVAFDRRGHGDSTTEDVAYSNRADTIAVLERLGIGRAALVGNSSGGQVAIDTAIEFPGRVAALIAIGANIGSYSPKLTAAEAELFEEQGRLEASADPDAIADFDVRLWVDGPGQPTDRVPQDIRELVREMDRQINAPGRVSGRPQPMHPPAAERLDRLTMPLLAIAGALGVSDGAATARYLEGHAPAARAEIMPNVAHMIGLEAPDELGRLILDFLEPLEAWS